MTFSIEYGKATLKFLSKLNKKSAERILVRIEKLLTSSPIPSDAKAIIGYQGVFRLRIGDFRALYRINYSNKRIIVFKIGKRSDVYTGL